MSNKLIEDTPRTFKEEFDPFASIEDEWVPDFPCVSAEFSRVLERELNAVNLERDKLRSMLDWIEDHSKYSGGGNGGTYTLTVTLDSECMLEQIGHEINKDSHP